MSIQSLGNIVISIAAFVSARELLVHSPLTKRTCHPKNLCMFSVFLSLPLFFNAAFNNNEKDF